MVSKKYIRKKGEGLTLINRVNIQLALLMTGKVGNFFFFFLQLIFVFSFLLPMSLYVFEFA